MHFTLVCLIIAGINMQECLCNEKWNSGSFGFILSNGPSSPTFSHMFGTGSMHSGEPSIISSCLEYNPGCIHFREVGISDRCCINLKMRSRIHRLVSDHDYEGIAPFTHVMVLLRPIPVRSLLRDNSTEFHFSDLFGQVPPNKCH